MAKTYTVDLGGKVRELRYTDSERDILESRFKTGLFKIITEMVLANDEQGRPTLGGVRAAQVALVWAGLRHAGGGVTEPKVASWLRAVMDAEGSYFEIVSKAVMAVYASGILGAKFEMPDEDESEGKAEPEATPEV